MRKKDTLGQIAIAVFSVAIIIEMWLIIGNGQLLSVVMDIWEEGKTLVGGITENNATSNILMKDDSCEYSDSDQKYYGKVLGSEISRDRIVAVTFVDTLDAVSDNAWDVSKNQNGTVMAWTEPNVSNAPVVDLFIGAEGKIAAEDCSGLFQGFHNVKTIEFNDCFDTSQVTNMDGMFSECESLIQLDVSNFDTSQVTHMKAMFNQCRSLTQLDVSNFDTSQVTDTGNMFCGCISLRQLDMGDFDTSRVADMGGMFRRCESLTQLDVSQFDTSRVVDMSVMFQECESLTQLDVSGFDTSQVTNMSGMFNGCRSLRQLDVDNFDTSQVTAMKGMFCDCKSLVELDVSSFDTSRVTNMLWMFEGCGVTDEEANFRMQ